MIRLRKFFIPLAEICVLVFVLAGAMFSLYGEGKQPTPAPKTDSSNGILPPLYKWGYIDTRGNFVIPAQYVTAGMFKKINGLFSSPQAEVSYVDNFGFIDSRGNFSEMGRRSGDSPTKELSPETIEQLQSDFDDSGVAVIKRRGGLELIDQKGTTLTRLPPVINSVSMEWSEGLLRFQTGPDVASQLYGYIDKRGHLAIPARYTQVYTGKQSRF